MKSVSIFILVMSCSYLLPAQKQQGSIPKQAIILFDAFGKDSTLQPGWGYAALISYGGKQILFDGGSNAGILRHNFKQKNIDARQIDLVIVSHAHHDHVNGLDFIRAENPGVKIYFPHDVFWGADGNFDVRGSDSSVRDSLPTELRYLNGTSYQVPVVQNGGRFWNANIEHVKSSKEILPGVRLIVTAASNMGYYFRKPLMQDSLGGCHDLQTQPLVEISLSLATRQGQALFSGCAHTGIDNIARQALAETGKMITLLAGGFHLIPYSRNQTENIVSDIRKQINVTRVAPGHCSGHLAFKMLKEAFGQQFVYAGLGETFLLE